MDHPGSEEASCLGWASRQMLGLQQKGEPSHPGAPLAGEGRQGETPGLQMASLSWPFHKLVPRWHGLGVLQTDAWALLPSIGILRTYCVLGTCSTEGE